MVKKVCFLLLLIIPGLGRSQQVVSCSGGSYVSSNTTFSYTIGEIAIESYASSNIIITQGFHQSYNSASAISQAQISTTLSVYPNPFHDIVNLDNAGETYSIRLYDLQGKLLLSQEGKPGNTQLNLSNLAKGMYLLKVRDLDNQQESIFKILKSNI